MHCFVISVISLVIILSEISLSFGSNKWKSRISMFPEQCSGSCRDSVAVDFMLKPGKICPGSISNTGFPTIEEQREAFIEDNAEICNIKVRYLLYPLM